MRPGARARGGGGERGQAAFPTEQGTPPAPRCSEACSPLLGPKPAAPRLGSCRAAPHPSRGSPPGLRHPTVGLACWPQPVDSSSRINHFVMCCVPLGGYFSSLSLSLLIRDETGWGDYVRKVIQSAQQSPSGNGRCDCGSRGDFLCPLPPGGGPLLSPPPPSLLSNSPSSLCQAYWGPVPLSGDAKGP